jgi:hypothetical protein
MNKPLFSQYYHDYKDILHAHYILGKLPAYTASVLKISRQTVYNALKWESQNRPNRGKMGRPGKLTDEIKLFIVFQTIATPTLSGDAL